MNVNPFREKILDYMGNKRIGFFPHLLLYVISLFYGLIVKTRLLLYEAGILRTIDLPCKVISIGNIVTGGSGKTPLAIHMARELKKSGLNVTVLSRGYKGHRRQGAVTDGKEILLSPLESGDEPYLIAEKLNGVSVVVGKNRVKAGMDSVQRFSPDVIILDDGFQHLRLKRDIDILLLDGKSMGSGFLLPRGPLREPLCSMERADVLLVKGEGLPAPPAPDGKPVFYFSYKASLLRDLNGKDSTGVDLLKGRRVLALSGIANPEQFFDTLKSLGAVVEKTLIYPDHHWYTPHDIETISRESKEVESIVTTEKDGVRLSLCRVSNLDIKTLSIEVALDDEEGFFNLIEARLRG